ncbi:hypothetical protein SAMN05892883_1965 [Jatrophihabitans sp. GAS493]|uniref:hypothetical protein n=1 Tax=Jatrophihabitans sp. GAS493 TaxID=1907575 RepID=UPI000BB7EC2B|nr:hypothetical protein [Jatrophihabitans sp. GAS493]SOD72587.1 hypothetical protein SAMN05892883_1965 [Jatrophihabitans sp. GAS493]
MKSFFSKRGAVGLTSLLGLLVMLSLPGAESSGRSTVLQIDGGGSSDGAVYIGTYIPVPDLTVPRP